MSFSHIQFGPKATPKALKILIITTLIVSLFSAVTNHIIPHYLGWYSFKQLLSLSIWGIDHLYFWQLLSYLFIHPTQNGISFSFLLSLAFNLYILWIIGASLIEKKGARHFFTLYFTSGIAVGLLIYAFQWATNDPSLFAGNSAALYSLLIAWLLLFPTADFLLFMILPMRASWLILSILAINILIDLSTGNLIRVIAYIASASFGYLYSRFFFKKKKTTPFYVHAKKFDFKTGKAILSDHEFLHEMQTKISLKGRASLTWKERLRLYKISKKNKKI